MPKRRVGVEYSLSTLEPVRLEAVSPERALYLPTFSHLVIVNTTPLSLSLFSLSLSLSLFSLSLSPGSRGRTSGWAGVCLSGLDWCWSTHSLLNLCTPIRHFHCPLQTTVAEYKLLLVPLQLEGRAAGSVCVKMV
jgi:hypothetical protein